MTKTSVRLRDEFDLHDNAFTPARMRLRVFPLNDAVGVVAAEPGGNGVPEQLTAATEVVVVKLVSVPAEDNEACAQERRAAARPSDATAFPHACFAFLCAAIRAPTDPNSVRLSERTG